MKKAAGQESWRDDVGPQSRNAFDAALHDVAGLEEELGRVRLADGDAAGRAGGEHVAGLERDVAREVLEDRRQLPDLVARVDAHALLAIDRAHHPQVVWVLDLLHGDDLGTQRAEAGDVLAGPEARARGDFALLRVAVGEVVEDGDAGDVIEGRGLLHAERALADDEDQLRLVIEPRDALRPGDLRVVTDEAGIQLDESRGL